MKKALIIGGEGFVGGHLSEYLLSLGYDVAITKLPLIKLHSMNEKISYYDLDILDTDNIVSVLTSFRPDFIFHLAAQSSISLSWKAPALTVDVNIKGTVNILESLRQQNIFPKILLVGSAEEYGSVDYSDKIKEEYECRPNNIYAISKKTQEMLADVYVKAYGFNIILTRSFNHFGVDQSPTFVIADFCSQVAKIEKGLQEPIIRVGNLSAYRDFTDVRDVVVAYELLINKGKIGEIYNVGTGKAVKIADILDAILNLADCKIDIIVDDKKIRPIDTLKIEADISKIIKDTGWQIKYDLCKSLKDILRYWRKNLSYGEETC